MSWAICFTGKVSTVTAAVEKYEVSIPLATEKAAFESAKATIVAALNCIDDSKVVQLTASGSAYAASSTCKKGGSLNIQMFEISNFLE